MFQLINLFIIEFGDCFKRDKTWQWFARAVMGCILRGDFRGVTSIYAYPCNLPEY
jgi:hypothetical protein